MIFLFDKTSDRYNLLFIRTFPKFAILEKILKVLDVDFAEVFQFEHHNNNEDLKTEIQKILDNNPDRIQDFYKIAKALVS